MPPCESPPVFTLPFKPANLFSFSTILMIPAMPSGSYLAPGLVITSISAIFAAGTLCRSDLISPPAILDGFPSIIRFTLELPLRLILSSGSTSTPGTCRKASMALPPVDNEFFSTLKTRFSAVWTNKGRSPSTSTPAICKVV